MEKQSGQTIETLYKVSGILCARVLVDHWHFNIDHQLPVTLGHSLFKQILELPVSYHDFQLDDTEYYDSRIKYILENDPEDLDITFSEIIMDEEHHQVKEVEFIPSQPQLMVIQENKLSYLRYLAHYRLSEVNKAHTEAFKEGILIYQYQFILILTTTK